MSSMTGAIRTRVVKKVEPPKPRKSVTRQSSDSSDTGLTSSQIDSVDKVLVLMITVISDIRDCNFNENLTSNIILLCNHLKHYGPQMENTTLQAALDEAFLVFREVVINNSLDYQARLKLLHILELREQHWKAENSDMAPYYNSRGEDLDEDSVSVGKSSSSSLFSRPMSASDISDIDLIRKSGKFSKPIKLAGKNYCKDEIIIRNSDSGKVQQTAKERLIQITGPSEDNIRCATQLIEETIRNNASPVIDSGESSSSLDSVGTDEGLKKATNAVTGQDYKYKYKVMVNDRELVITGNDYNYVTLAKTALDDFFSKLAPETPLTEDILFDGPSLDINADPGDVFGKHSGRVHVHNQESGDFVDDVFYTSLKKDISAISISEDDIVIKNARRPIIYTRDFMEKLSSSELSNKKPDGWEKMVRDFPDIINQDS